jgi:hypothetical protein
MGRRRRLLIALLAVLIGGVVRPPVALTGRMPVPPQSQPATATSPSGELPAEILASLSSVGDFAFNFDHPAVYGLLEHLQNTPLAPGHTRQPVDIADWRVLLERPSDFRGEPVVVEGVVGHNRPWEYVGAEHPGLGAVWQLDLERRDQPIACTVLLTHDAGDIPLRATIRVTGYFVMIRQYYSETNRVRQAALLAAQAPTIVAQAAPRATAEPARGWMWLIVVLTAGLLVTWILLRRSAIGRPRDLEALHAEREAPMSLADDLAAWAAEDETAGDQDEQPDRIERR